MSDDSHGDGVQDVAPIGPWARQALHLPPHDFRMLLDDRIVHAQAQLSRHELPAAFTERSVLIAVVSLVQVSEPRGKAFPSPEDKSRDEDPARSTRQTQSQVSEAKNRKTAK